VTAARILMTGSREWSNGPASVDALNAAVNLLGSSSRQATLVHGAAQGADQLLDAAAKHLGLATEAHPAEWRVHTASCPTWCQGRDTCKLAGHRRNAEMIAAGADLVLAFPTHSYALAPGENRERTSRGTWDCADKAKAAGLPTLVIWGPKLFPFGDAGLELLTRAAHGKSIQLGPAGEMGVVDAWLPF